MAGCRSSPRPALNSGPSLGVVAMMGQTFNPNSFGRSACRSAAARRGATACPSSPRSAASDTRGAEAHPNLSSGHRAGLSAWLYSLGLLGVVVGLAPQGFFNSGKQVA